MARYQEIEIDETHRVHDILKKIERLYIRPYIKQQYWLPLINYLKKKM